MESWRKIAVLILTIALSISAVGRTERDTLGVGGSVSFVENAGQWGPGAYSYAAQLYDAAVFMEDGAVTVALRSHHPHPGIQAEKPRHHAYRMTFGSSSAPRPDADGMQEGYLNFYLGNDPSSWRSQVHSYSRVVYTSLYPGIDLEVYGAERALKYNFLVHPGGHPADISIIYEGTDGVEVTKQGDLRIRTSVRDIIELRPYVYQQAADGDREIGSRWRVSRGPDGTYTAAIDVEDTYDTTAELVIDPMLIFSTYTGSVADNWGTTATYDAKKNVYTAGLVFGVGYPASLGAYQTSFGGSIDIGIFKFDSTGSQRLFATYLGGSSVDMPHSMIVNSFDELLIFGTTGSANFPVTASAYQTTFGGGSAISYLSYNIPFDNGSDIFVSRLSADGTNLEASTYVGGNGNDGLNYRNYYNNDIRIVMAGNDSLYKNYGDGARGEIITDQLNNVYIGSTTFSANFPTTPGSVQPTLGGRQDGVVFKLDHNLHTLLWSTYLGGSMDDAVYSIDVDKEYNLLVCGGTSSSDFPTTPEVYQPFFGSGNADGFVSKISYGGEELMASSYFGELEYDQLYFVRTGIHDDVFVFGQTHPSGSSMIRNAAYSVNNSGMLLARFSPLLDTLRWSTVFGTPGRINLSPTAFGVDICDRLYAVGWGRDFVGYNNVNWHTAGTTGMETTDDAYQDSTDGQDFYIMSLSSDASTLEFASFFGELHGGPNTKRGSDHVDGGTSRFDRQSTLYQSVCASCSGDNGFPVTSDAWSSENKSNNCNNGLFRFNVHSNYPVAEFTLPPSGCAPYTLQFENTGRGTSFLWDFGDGTTSTESAPTHTYTTPGLYTVTLIATLEGGCKAHDTVSHTLQVLGDEAHSHSPEISCNGTKLQIGVTPSLGATYLWSGDPVSDSTVANPWVNQTGTYILHTSAEGCAQTDTFFVSGLTLIDQSQFTAISCHDSSDGRVHFRLGIGIDPDSVTIAVNPERPVGSVTQSGFRWYFAIDSLAPDVSYTVTVTGQGCSYSTSFKLPNPPYPTLQKEAHDVLCSDSCDGSILIRYNFSAVPETPPLDTLLDNLCEGTYITHLVSLGCPVSDTTVIRREHALDSLRATADRQSLILGESTQLHATGVTGPATYQWTPSADIDHPDSRDPLATPHDTLVCYTVTATTATGCSATDSVCIHCTEIACGEPDFVIPNAFTPNDDGINDRICFESDAIAEFHIAIFNRWGQLVFESENLNSCWDGMFRNEKCLAGVYTYTCHIRCHGGQENDFKGDITLIR